jgi:hypothetical protein
MRIAANLTCCGGGVSIRHRGSETLADALEDIDHVTCRPQYWAYTKVSPTPSSNRFASALVV